MNIDDLSNNEVIKISSRTLKKVICDIIDT